MAEIIEEDELCEEFETDVASVSDIERSLLPGNESEHEGDFTQYSESPYDYDDLFNFDVSVAITEVETDEMTSEFSYALSEIDGEMSFPCTLCDKVCKSKGDLSRHTNSKHSEASSGWDAPVFCKENVDSFIQAIKDKIIKEKLYGTEIISLDAASSTEALFNALLPIYKTLCRKKNGDKLLETFYGLMPRSRELLSCQDYRVANLIMIHLPERLIEFYNTSKTSDTSIAKERTHLDPAEYGPLTYVAGYVIPKLYQLKQKQTRNYKICYKVLEAQSPVITFLIEQEEVL